MGSVRDIRAIQILPRPWPLTLTGLHYGSYLLTDPSPFPFPSSLQLEVSKQPPQAGGFRKIPSGNVLALDSPLLGCNLYDDDPIGASLARVHSSERCWTSDWRARLYRGFQIKSISEGRPNWDRAALVAPCRCA